MSRNKYDANSQKFTIIFIAISICMLAASPIFAYEGRVINLNSSVEVNYLIRDGYRVSIVVNTEKRKEAFVRHEHEDVVSIEVDFIDLNQDGLDDIILRLIDETGYTPIVLLNIDNMSFVSALPDKAIYINTELEISDGRAFRPKSYELRRVVGREVSDLVFYRVYIGPYGHRYVIFRYDHQLSRYVLYQKGELIGTPLNE